MEHSNEITEKLTIVLLELRKTIKDLKLKNKSLITQFDEINFKYNELIKSIKEKKTDVNEKHYKTQILEENFNFSQSLHDNSNFINDELNKKSQNTENIQTESNNKDQNKIQTESNINKQNSNDIEKNSKVLSSPEKIKNYEEAMVKLHQQKKSLKQKNDELLSKLVSLQVNLFIKNFLYYILILE